jgi:RNA polymerase sigma-70 factor (ECF subfamily)
MNGARSPREEDVRDLLERARDGDHQALEDVLARYRPPLRERIRVLMGPGARRVADSEDFVQEALIEVLQALERYRIRDERSFLRWATQIARNNIRDQVRRRHEQVVASFTSQLLGEEAGTGAKTPSGEAALGEDVLRMFEALERLRPMDRLVLELRDLQGLPYSDIAAQLDHATVEAVIKRHARAMRRLSRILAGHDETR